MVSPMKIAEGAAADRSGLENLLGNAIDSFRKWLESNGERSFAPYDIWGIRY